MKKVFFAALALTLFVGCGAQTESSSTGTTEVVKVATKSTKAYSAKMNQTEQFTAEIIAYKENNITPAASGVRIDKIFFEVGDVVKEGEIVATLDPTMYNQQLLNVNNLKADFERLLPVYEAGGISRQTMEQAKTALDVQSEVAANLKKNIELRSPISGVVTERNAEAGDLFMNQAILHIASIDRVKVNVQISEQFFPNVKVGMPVEMSVDIYPEEMFYGKVSLIYPSLNAATRTFTAEVTIPNPSLKLRAGMFGRTSFNMGSKDTILVPDVAVQKQFGSSENFVYVVEDGVATRRRVTKGRQDGSMVDILSGVKAGDEVIVTAFSRIGDGTQVEIKK